MWDLMSFPLRCIAKQALGYITHEATTLSRVRFSVRQCADTSNYRLTLAHIDFLEESLQQLQQEIEQQLSPFEETMSLVQSVIEIQETSAAALLAEMGTEMSRFPSAKHLASWAGVCPGNKQSAGKATPISKRSWRKCCG